MQIHVYRDDCWRDEMVLCATGRRCVVCVGPSIKEKTRERHISIYTCISSPAALFVALVSALVSPSIPVCSWLLVIQTPEPP